MDAGAPRSHRIVLAPVVLALLFDLAVGAPAPAPHRGDVAPHRLRPVALAMESAVTAAAERPAIVLLHALSAGLVFAVLRLSLGSDRAALFAAALWAVAPAHRRAASGGDGLDITLAAALALASLALALPARPRPWTSAALYAAALLSHPASLATAVVVGLARGRFPWPHAAAFAAVIALRGYLLASGALAVVAGPEGWLAGLGRAFDDVLPIGPGAGLAILALCLAAAIARGPWLRRSSVWCAALFLYALPWAAIAGEESVPAPGSALLATLPLVALAAEGWLRARRWTPSPLALGGLEAVAIAGFAVLGL